MAPTCERRLTLAYPAAQVCRTVQRREEGHVMHVVMGANGREGHWRQLWAFAE